MRARLTAATLLGTLLTGCASAQPRLDTPASALELRAFQAREFPNCDETAAARAVLQALQDAGFAVVAAEHEVGPLSFSRETSRGGRNGAINAVFWYPYLIPFRGLLPKEREFLKVDVTASVRALGDRASVRLNADLRVHDKKHVLKRVEPIRDVQFYQDLFASIDKALFLDAAGL